MFALIPAVGVAGPRCSFKMRPFASEGEVLELGWSFGERPIEVATVTDF
jgi:hypothetical protein